MEPAFKKDIVYFETRVHLEGDMSLVETFHDGSQLVHKRSLMVIIEAQKATITPIQIKAEPTLFSTN